MAKTKKKTKAKPRQNVKKTTKKLHKCEICDKAFSDRYNLSAHIQTHSDETPFSCPLCPYKGKTKKYLSRHHRQVHTERNKYKCTYCGKFFLHPSDLRDHIMVHTGEKPLSCDVCGKSFRVSYSLKTHMLIHKNEKPYRCSFCDYSCRDSSTLRKHQNRHMGLESVYQCKICNKGYKVKSRLKMHVAEVHLDVDVRTVPCGQCDSRFKSVSKKNRHVILKHERALACNCPVCGFRLASKYNLREHMRRHMDERPFACTHPGCEQAFKNKGCLQKHSKIHDPSQHYACSHCGRTFARKTHMTQHELVMHAQRARNVQCDYCGAKFYSKNYLLKHIQTKHIHKSKFKYICDICGLTTHNKPSIVMHLKYGHTNDEDLQCKLCDNKVIYKKHMYLKSHYWKSHNVRYKIDSRRITRTNKEETKPRIKEEPTEEESYEEIQLLDVEKRENASEDENESLEYSKQVLSEDITELVLRDEKVDGKVDFDDFYIKNIIDKQEEKPDVSKPYVNVNKEEDQLVKQKIKHILIRTLKHEKAKAERKKKKEEERLRKEKEEEEARRREEEERQEIIELRRVREMYNERMKAAAEREMQKKDKVNIKYFKKKPEVSKTVTEGDENDDDLEKESIENDTTMNKSGTNDDTDYDDDDDENTPLNSLIAKINSSVKGNVDDSKNADENVNLNITEKDLAKELNENNTDTDNMDIEEDLNIGNIVFIERNTLINKDEVVNQLSNTNNTDLTDNENRVQSYDASHNKNDVEVDNQERLGGWDESFTDCSHTKYIDKDNCHQNNDKQDNIDKNHDHTYVKNHDENKIAQDKHTTRQEIKEVIGNDKQQTSINSDEFGNNHGVVRNDKDENNDNKVMTNGNEVTNDNEVIINDKEVSDDYVTLNGNEVVTNDDLINDEVVDSVNSITINANEIVDNDVTIHEKEVVDSVNDVTITKNEIINNEVTVKENEVVDGINNATIDENEVVNNDITMNENEVFDSVNDATCNENEVVNNDVKTNENEVGDSFNDVTINKNEIINVTVNENEVVDSVNDATINENDVSNSDSDNDKRLRKRTRKKRVIEDPDYEIDDKDVDEKKAKKMEFKTHQCYVCFKLYQTKEELINHCQDHFDICNVKTLGKCPICNHVSYKVSQHMRRKHKIRIKVPFNKLKDRKTTDGSRYCYEIDGGEIEVIPSIKILNKTASMEIDKKRREKRDKTIARSKLVKKGKTWIVEKEYLDLTYDELPELTDIELTKCKVTGNDIDRLGQISRIAKKKGLKMMFPCFECDKVCQNFSALKLHKRRHEVNPKPFAPRVKNGARNAKKESKIKLDKSNRTALPKPIKTNHKCDDRLKEFFESNIRGGDIEFWQFLKIFNKMDREKVNDFKDLEERSDFGNHLDYYRDEDIDMDEMAAEIDKYIEVDDSENEIVKDDEISEVNPKSSNDL